MPNHYRYYANFFRSVPDGLLRRLVRKRCQGYSNIRPFLAGRSGLEIGGPSRLFADDHLIPAYGICGSIDACNFSEDNLWSDSVDYKKFGSQLRTRFVAEACDLNGISDGTYDFVLASHVLEHTANPLRALQEWKRVLVDGGMLLLVLPHKDGTFDRYRPFTSFEHLVADFASNVSEDDLTHLEEIVSLHDLSQDPPAGSRDEFRSRCLQNASIRAMHHHVFSPGVLSRMMERTDMRVLSLSIERPFHIVIAAVKAPLGK